MADVSPKLARAFLDISATHYPEVRALGLWLRRVHPPALCMVVMVACGSARVPAAGLCTRQADATAAPRSAPAALRPGPDAAHSCGASGAAVQRLGMFLILDAPSLFGMLWRAIQSFVDPKTYTKIRSGRPATPRPGLQRTPALASARPALCGGGGRAAPHALGAASEAPALRPAAEVSQPDAPRPAFHARRFVPYDPQSPKSQLRATLGQLCDAHTADWLVTEMAENRDHKKVRAFARAPTGPTPASLPRGRGGGGGHAAQGGGQPCVFLRCARDRAATWLAGRVPRVPRACILLQLPLKTYSMSHIHSSASKGDLAPLPEGQHDVRGSRALLHTYVSSPAVLEPQATVQPK